MLLAARGARLWLLVRLALAMLMLLAQGAPLAIGTAATAWAIGIAVGLGFVQAHRLRERIFFANLGFSQPQQAAALIAGTTAPELILRLAMGLI